MREIKFRGKTLLGEWVVGILTHDLNKEKGLEWFISNNSGNPYVIRPETIGQFTGLKDQDGEDIFEGDILETHDHIDSVCWRDDLCGFSFRNDKSRMNLVDWLEHGQYSGTKIIGQVY